MKLYTGYRGGSLNERQREGEAFVPVLKVEDLPDSVNWNDKGWLTPIKNQVSTETRILNCCDTLPFRLCRGRASVVPVGHLVPLDLLRDSISIAQAN